MKLDMMEFCFLNLHAISNSMLYISFQMKFGCLKQAKMLVLRKANGLVLLNVPDNVL